VRFVSFSVDALVASPMLLFLSFVLLVASQQKLIYNVGDQYSFDFYGQVNHGVQQNQPNAPPTEVSSRYELLSCLIWLLERSDSI
jgi:hypothetical protein